MKPEFFLTSLEHLGSSHFARTWPEESVRALYDEVADIPDVVIVAAWKRIRTEMSPARFPSLRTVMSVITEEFVKRNLANSPAEARSRQENDRQFASIFGDRAGKHADHAMRLLTMIVDRNVPRSVVFEGIEAMAKSYPGVGWDDTLLDHIRRHGEQVIDLDRGSCYS